jgi:hypothetical protein
LLVKSPWDIKLNDLGGNRVFTHDYTPKVTVERATTIYHASSYINSGSVTFGLTACDIVHNPFPTVELSITRYPRCP